MKRLLFAISLLVILVQGSFGQFSNSWIEDHDQTYVRIKVSKTGIYRIPYGVLQARIPNLASISPDRFQVFARGEEQHIYVQGESSNTFHSSQGYIEFFAEKNDGWLDTELYDDPDHQPNVHRSLFNDTISYFLTYNNGGANKRITPISYTSPQGVPANYLLKETVGMATGKYIPGPLDSEGKSNPNYAEGEGWYSGEFGFSAAEPFGNGRSIKVVHKSLYTGNDAPNVSGEAVFTGISNANGFVNNHKVKISFRDASSGSSPETTLSTITYDGYDLQRPPFSISPGNLGSDSSLFIFHHNN